MRIAFIPAVNMDVSAMPASTMVRREAPAYNDTKNIGGGMALGASYDFGSFKLCGEGEHPKTFLLPGQPAKGQKL